MALLQQFAPSWLLHQIGQRLETGYEPQARARALCMQVGDMPQIFPALRGLCAFYLTQGALLTARQLGEQLDLMVQRAVVSTPSLECHDTLGDIGHSSAQGWQGEVARTGLFPYDGW
jgi:hypothetical protein